MKNEFLNNIYEEYINKLDFSVENYASFSQMVKIDLILGISYPFIIPIFKEIDKYINSSLIENYLENKDNWWSEKIGEIKNYFDEKNNIENNLKIEFEKKYFTKIFNENQLNLNKQKLGELLVKDYIIYYLSKSNYKFTNKNIIDFYMCVYLSFF